MALPVTLDDAKRQLKIIGDDDDAEINDFILDAAGWVEGYTGHLLEQRQVTERFSSFERIRLGSWPITAETVTVTHAGIAIAGARLSAVTRPAGLLPAVNGVWPVVSTGDVIEVTYSAGYADPASVPREIRRAMLILIAAYDADREGREIVQQAEKTARNLCRRLKSWSV